VPAAAAASGQPVAPAGPAPTDPQGPLAWLPPAEKELGKIPFFVRGKVRKNTERFARERGLPEISLETLYDAKAHYGR
jgi:light-independent protochlorophyllide reductase subunit B